VNRVKVRCAHNLFATLKSADNHHDPSQPADSACVLDGQQDVLRLSIQATPIRPLPSSNKVPGSLKYEHFLAMQEMISDEEK
jgi:hypothetical protein